MNDRELLEAAAKAIGMKVFDWMPGRSGFAHGDSITNRWNPLTDDGDALRLAVKLSLEIVPVEGGGIDVSRWSDAVQTVLVCEHGADKETATRRAIVRAAAEMAVG